MGKWAQQRKRGSAGHGPVALPPPPAPQLLIIEDSVYQLASSDTDTNGSLKLYYSTSGGEPWNFISSVIWKLEHYWGSTDYYQGDWLRATEVGNDLDYAGESQPSNVLAL